MEARCHPRLQICPALSISCQYLLCSIAKHITQPIINMCFKCKTPRDPHYIPTRPIAPTTQGATSNKPSSNITPTKLPQTANPAAKVGEPRSAQAPASASSSPAGLSSTRAAAATGAPVQPKPTPTSKPPSSDSPNRTASSSQTANVRSRPVEPARPIRAVNRGYGGGSSSIGFYAASFGGGGDGGGGC